MGNRMISVICAVLALAGIVLLAVGYGNYSRKQAQISANYAELSDKLSVLEAEKTAAEKIIREIDEDVMAAAEINSTVSLIFRDGSEKIYTEIFPPMKKYGIKGVLTVSKDTIPGGEGLLTGDRLNELVEAGWVIIPEWTDGDGDNGIASVEEWARLSGYILGKAVLIPQDSYTPELESLVVGAGYTTVIKNLGAGGEDVVFSDKIGDAWAVGAMGYVGDKRNTVVTTAVEGNGHMTFIVGFEDEFELYDAGKFSAMLSYLTTHEGNIEIMDIISAGAYRKDGDARLAAAESAAAEQKAEHLAKIEEIDKKISDIYKKYGVNGAK